MISTTSARNGDVLLPEREQQQEQQLAHSGVDLADHAEVEEVDPLVPPEQVPRVRVGVEEALGEDLAVVALEQLPRRLGARGAVRRLAHGTPWISSMHEQPRLVESSS